MMTKTTTKFLNSIPFATRNALVIIVCCLTLVVVVHGQDINMYSYDPLAENGPLNWGNLDIVGNQCGNGQAQSGIDIVTHPTCNVYEGFQHQDGDCTFGDLFFTIDPRTANIFLNIDSCQNVPQFQIMNGSISYNLFHVNIHAGSEHSIDGRLADAELHLVHSTPESNHFGIISLLIQARRDMGDHPLIQYFVERFHHANPFCGTGDGAVPQLRNNDGVSSATNGNDEALNAPFLPYQSLIPRDTALYHYEGSFTQPPCNEVVTYMVSEQVLTISQPQLDSLRSFILNWQNPNNYCLPGTIAFNETTARPIQPLNGRTVQRICQHENPGLSLPEIDANNLTPDDTDSNNNDASGGSSRTLFCLDRHIINVVWLLLSSLVSFFW